MERPASCILCVARSDRWSSLNSPSSCKSPSVAFVQGNSSVCAGVIWISSVGGFQSRRPRRTKAVTVSLEMSAKLFQVLTAHRREARFTGDGDFVFCQPDGRPMDPDSLRKLGIYPALARAGVPFRKRASGCHAFRHLVATVVHKKTGSLKLAQEQRGHSNVSTAADI